VCSFAGKHRILFSDGVCLINLRTGNLVRFLDESVRYYNNMSRHKIARHPYLKLLKLPEVTFQFLEVLAVRNFPIISHPLEQGEEFRLVLIGEILKKFIAGASALRHCEYNRLTASSVRYRAMHSRLKVTIKVNFMQMSFQQSENWVCQTRML
jgi:hypothetical protein